MDWYKNLSFPFKIIVVIFSLLSSGLLIHFLTYQPHHVALQTASFLSLFFSLFVLFNLADFKLYNRIFIGLGLGIVAGIVWGSVIDFFQPVGQAFIQLIKMIVIPLVFASLLVGTASISDIKKLGRIGARTIIFYIVSTALAITLGLVIANVVQPGSSIPEDIQSELNQNYGQEAQNKISVIAERPSTIELLINIIPDNPARSMADGKMLQIIFFAMLSGIALTYIRQDKREIIIKFFDGITDITINLVHMIMKLAPYGVFALIAFVIAQYGSDIILTLISYFLTTLFALFLHVLVFNSAVIKIFTNLKLSEFWKGIYPALLVAFSTSSSSATLPVTMECAEKNLRVKPEVASFVLPLGSTINMDGTAIFQGVSALFIATVYGMSLTVVDQLTIILTATLASIGTAGAPQVGIIMLTIVLQSIGIPLEGIALILGVERFLDMARTSVNVTSDLSCASFISSKEE
jgi:Na+/H+-dicarboxylate symporter